MPANKLAYLFDWFELAASCPAELFLEELSCSVGVMVSPKDAKVFLDSPSLGRLKVGLFYLFKAGLLPLAWLRGGGGGKANVGVCQ
jgi:hypothetical protein